MTTAPLHTARADVVTDVPERYAKQLVAHLGRKLEWTQDGATSTASIGTGTGSVAVGEGRLTLAASADDPSALAVVQDVLGRHLERFGTRDELAVVWTSDEEARA